MTWKEKLATEYVNFKKELMGDAFKVIDLKDKIEVVKLAIKKKEQKFSIEAYYNTTEGAIYKTEHENCLNILTDKYMQLNSMYSDIILKKIQYFFGEYWDAYVSLSQYRTYIEIGLKSENTKKEGKLKFGHTFEINIEESWKCIDNIDVTMNYGTLGCFNPIDDTDRIEYLNGMSSFIKDNECLNEIIRYAKEVMSKLKEIDKEITETKNKLENPKYIFN